MSNLSERVEESIRKRGLLRRGQAVVIAVSGGVDSMVLLHILCELGRTHSWRLAVAHLNHRLRGRSSDADERLVVRVSRGLDLPVVVERSEVRELARVERLSVEMAARKARHDFLARAAARLKIPTIALAHHADDQLELFFLRLFRGSSSEGLAGMKWRNPSPGDPKVDLIRPLLDLPKRDLEKFARENKIFFREDATNASLDIQRNRVRHELLPLLRRNYQAGLDRTILRVMEIAGAEAEFVGQVAGEWLSGIGGTNPPACRARKAGPVAFRKSACLAGQAFADLPVAVQRRCIQLQLLHWKIAVDFDLIERLRTSWNCPVSVVPGLAVTLDAAGELHSREPMLALTKAESLEVELKGRAGKIPFEGRNFRWSISGHRASIKPESRAGREFFDADKVGLQIILRHWLPGDRFQPIGMSSPVKLQDLFVNQKIARARRHGLVVATTAAGELFWVEKLRISERFKLVERTNRCLQWRWNPL